MWLRETLRPWIPGRLRRRLRSGRNVSSRLIDKAVVGLAKASSKVTLSRPKHVILCGASGAGKTTLHTNLRSVSPAPTFAPEYEIPALKTLRSFSRRLITDRALDIFSSSKIIEDLGEARDIYFILCVRDPRSLICAKRDASNVAGYFQGYDYAFFVSSRIQSYAYPGVVESLRTVQELHNRPDVSSTIVRYEDLVADPENVTLKIVSESGLSSLDSISDASRGKLRQNIRDAEIDKRDADVWLRSEHRERVLRQLHLCPELEELALALGYPPASAYGIDLSAPPPPPLDGTIVAFHTDDDIYRAEAARFTRRLDELGLKYDITVVPPRGEWVENCAMKPEFLLDVRKRLRGPLLYLDVDAYVHSDPWPYLSLYEGDMAAYIHPDGELTSGSLFLSDESKTVTLLKEWSLGQKRAPREWDQRVLQKIITAYEASKSDFIFQRLPPNMNFIFDKNYEYLFGKPVVEQLQASRELKDSDTRTRRARLSELESQKI